MIGYKVRYEDYGYDCWGKSEFAGYIDYDKVIYLKYESAEKIKRKAENQHPDKKFSIYEVEIEGG